MTTCLSGSYIVTGAFSIATMTVWSSIMTSQQVLNYPFNNVISMDCSMGYLVSLDNSNYLAIDSYSSTDADIAALVNLAGWIIGVIVGGVVLIIVSIILCICCCCCRRRSTATEMAMNMNMNNTMGQELIITSPNAQYNNGQYNGQFNGQYNTQYNGPTGEVRY